MHDFSCDLDYPGEQRIQLLAKRLKDESAARLRPDDPKRAERLLFHLQIVSSVDCARVRECPLTSRPAESPPMKVAGTRLALGLGVRLSATRRSHRG